MQDQLSHMHFNFFLWVLIKITQEAVVHKALQSIYYTGHPCSKKCEIFYMINIRIKCH